MPTNTMSLTSSHGVTLEFAGTSGLITHVQDLDVSESVGTEDTSDLSIPDGGLRDIEPSQLTGGIDLKLTAEYATGSAMPTLNDEGDLTTSLGNITGWAVCTNVEIAYQTGEVVGLNLSFKVGEEPD